MVQFCTSKATCGNRLLVVLVLKFLVEYKNSIKSPLHSARIPIWNTATWKRAINHYGIAFPFNNFFNYWCEYLPFTFNVCINRQFLTQKSHELASSRPFVVHWPWRNGLDITQYQNYTSNYSTANRSNLCSSKPAKRTSVLTNGSLYFLCPISTVGRTNYTQKLAVDLSTTKKETCVSLNVAHLEVWILNYSSLIVFILWNWNIDVCE